MIIPRTSTAQKNPNDPIEIVCSLSTVVIWSAGTLPPVMGKRNKVQTVSCFYTKLDSFKKKNTPLKSLLCKADANLFVEIRCTY